MLQNPCTLWHTCVKLSSSAEFHLFTSSASCNNDNDNYIVQDFTYSFEFRLSTLLIINWTHKAVGEVIGSTILVISKALRSISLVIPGWTLRSINWKVTEVGTKSVTMCVIVGEETSLECE